MLLNPHIKSRVVALARQRGLDPKALTSAEKLELLALAEAQGPIPVTARPVKFVPPPWVLSKASGGTGGGGVPGGGR